MTKISKSRTALGLAAISTAVLGCTAISAETDSMTREAHAQATAPVACAVNIQTSGNGFVLEPVVQANEAVSGIYQLRVEGPGTRMNQGGPFSANAGQTVELGRMQMSGSASSLDAELTLTIDGRNYSCPVSL
ncbi:curli-like amyloid fiber formation chaperone CsgH [Hasllibacter sp. MH4015]|uniref:curli-like amyloid fiber formation chaperone CsgH n=1 Tax=Hasllibacter sp. MH4015 TaxID=2854029 RepID=UPI001CD75EC4|nr:curli-like amyloid fiber formation chaperone CsgH [Hasllibacter sp. MH4015]